MHKRAEGRLADIKTDWQQEEILNYLHSSNLMCNSGFFSLKEKQFACHNDDCFSAFDIFISRNNLFLNKWSKPYYFVLHKQLFKEVKETRKFLCLVYTVKLKHCKLKRKISKARFFNEEWKRCCERKNSESPTHPKRKRQMNLSTMVSVFSWGREEGSEENEGKIHKGCAWGRGGGGGMGKGREWGSNSGSFFLETS